MAWQRRGSKQQAQWQEKEAGDHICNSKREAESAAEVRQGYELWGSTPSAAGLTARSYMSPDGGLRLCLRLWRTFLVYSTSL